MKTKDPLTTTRLSHQRPLTPTLLRRETNVYRNQGGVSAENRFLGFAPAFQDTETGAVYPSRFADGRIAPMHLLDGLPGKLVQRRESGTVTAVKATIIAGFLYQGEFLTRQQTARALHPREAVELR